MTPVQDWGFYMPTRNIRLTMGSVLMLGLLLVPVARAEPPTSVQIEVNFLLGYVEGSEEHICGEEKFLMKAGDVCVHPPNVKHGGHTDTGYKGIDVFSPLREDYLALMKKHGLR